MDWVDATQLETVESPRGERWDIEVKQSFGRRAGGLAALVAPDPDDATWLVTWRRRAALDWLNVPERVEKFPTEREAVQRAHELADALRQGTMPV